MGLGQNSMAHLELARFALLLPSVTQLDGERKNVAKLLKVATRPHQADQDMGDFYLSFTIHLMNP